ncbi:hypothetical protein [Nitratiruptor sp. YY09-18]|uniref:hypothetical protein n=1 Tax=Nitratiruptor sp. YY09-18 TaxID=2724901 RepID=UPI00191682FE|nr:hypothetical protein [Nitratiruptor sp. YY09-18]BCD68774.1 hypothetical protein NitYY0918_C1691 [Nitratiruptor sp. YY09-18]
MKRVALLVDWENFRKEINYLQQKDPYYKQFDYNDPDKIYDLFLSCFSPYEEIFKIFFYTAKPLKPQEIEETFAKRPGCNAKKYLQIYKKEQQKIDRIIEVSENMLEELVKKDYISLRLGELQVLGQMPDGNPVIAQKKVDMLIGLDIAHLAFNKQVEQIKVLCKDKDISPALKVARISGIITTLIDIGGFHISKDLYKHLDKVEKVQIL